MHELGVVFHVIKIVEEVAAENQLTEVGGGVWRYRVLSAELLEMGSEKAQCNSRRCGIKNRDSSGCDVL